MKIRFKKSVIASLIMVLLLPAMSAFAEENTESVTQDNDIQARLTEISNSYDLNEPLSDKDAEFVKTYAIKPAASGEFSTQAVQRQTFSGYKNSQGIDGRMDGYVTFDNGIIDREVRAYMKVWDGNGKARNITAGVRFTGFGVINDQGNIGKTVDTTLSGSSSGKQTSYTMDKTYRYRALDFVTFADPSATIDNISFVGQYR
ncbi:hypothetical protein [Paenibacillus sp. FSL L8-0638]|uniref:hypothetical protein n=1 Tax=Paenibacillus TaxID=44249 RepID=UPI003159735F